MAESLPDPLWKEYRLVFEKFDDLTLARWLAQTIAQLEGQVWRFSHPLIGAYRLGAEVGDERQSGSNGWPLRARRLCRSALLPGAGSAAFQPGYCATRVDLPALFGNSRRF